MKSITAPREQRVARSCVHDDATTHKMPGHWVLAKMGKRVLRPGGLKLTRAMLDVLELGPTDDVVEFAPGLGVTMRLALAHNPASYTAIERDAQASETVRQSLMGTPHRCLTGTAEATGLPSESASVVYGEAMLSMQPPAAKARIIQEAARVLRTGGRYGIHELCLVPNDVGGDIRDGIQSDLSDEIHVGVRPLTVSEWRTILESAGFKVVAERSAPMHLLEPRRLVQDEGLVGAARFVWNVATHSVARARVLRMRRIFRKYRRNLAAVALVCVKTSRSMRP